MGLDWSLGSALQIDTVGGAGDLRCTVPSRLVGKNPTLLCRTDSEWREILKEMRISKVVRDGRMGR